jgi:EAL and modified HD-GYP domain-containing signal transduction protein
VSNARNEWVALALDFAPGTDDAIQAALTLLNTPDMLAALAPLDCILPIPDPLLLETAHLEAMPAQRVILRIPAAALEDPAVQNKCAAWADAGHRLMVEGFAGGNAAKSGVRALMFDCAAVLPPQLTLMAQPGPHLAANVAHEARLAE